MTVPDRALAATSRAHAIAFTLLGEIQAIDFSFAASAIASTQATSPASPLHNERPGRRPRARQAAIQRCCRGMQQAGTTTGQPAPDSNDDGHLRQLTSRLGHLHRAT